METDLFLTGTPAAEAEARTPPGRSAPVHWWRRFRWPLALAGLVLASAAGSYALGKNAQHADRRFDRSHAALAALDGRIGGELDQLGVARSELHLVHDQVGTVNQALVTTSNALRWNEWALNQGAVNVADQSTLIGDLQTCLGGVQQALNAISVGDQNHGVAELQAVSAQCHAAFVFDG